MLRAWPLLFFIVPLVEIYLLIQVGERIGALTTVLIVIITAIIGVTLLREQGFRTLMKANAAMQAGQMPAQEMFEGFILASVGILLVTPGFFTDAIGFLLLVPAVRRSLMKALLRHMTVQAQGPFYSAHYEQRDRYERPRREEIRRDKDGHHTIDGDFKRED